MLGLVEDNNETYIYDVNYDLKKIRIKLGRSGTDTIYSINPAFVSALDIKDALNDWRADRVEG